jgi:hypothetical protein
VGNFGEVRLYLRNGVFFPDVERKWAFDELLGRLGDAEKAVSALKPTLADPRITEARGSRVDASQTDTVSFEYLANLLDGSDARFLWLQKKLRSTQVVANTLRNASVRLVPIQRLPGQNLLRSIFCFAADLTPKRTNSFYKTRSSICSVCRLWNHICSTINIFWTSLNFNDGLGFERTTVNIQRSYPTPLSVEPNVSELHYRDCFDETLAILAAIVSRIGTLTMSGAP